MNWPVYERFITLFAEIRMIGSNIPDLSIKIQTIPVASHPCPYGPLYQSFCLRWLSFICTKMSRGGTFLMCRACWTFSSLSQGPKSQRASTCNIIIYAKSWCLLFVLNGEQTLKMAMMVNMYTTRYVDIVFSFYLIGCIFKWQWSLS